MLLPGVWWAPPETNNDILNVIKGIMFDPTYLQGDLYRHEELRPFLKEQPEQTQSQQIDSEDIVGSSLYSVGRQDFWAELRPQITSRSIASQLRVSNPMSIAANTKYDQQLSQQTQDVSKCREPTQCDGDWMLSVIGLALTSLANSGLSFRLLEEES